MERQSIGKRNDPKRQRMAGTGERPDDIHR
jgi:hypothetical protein